MNTKRNYGRTGTIDLGGERPRSWAALDKEETMEKVKAAATPGPAHEALGHLIGDWQAEVRCWMEPGGETETNAGSAKGTWIMNGLFLQEDFTGEMMGRPFSGRTILGYDNVQETFKMVWLADNQTSMFVAEGSAEDDYRVIILEGTGTCPVRGEIRTRVVVRLLSPDRRELEMYDLTQGEPSKTMEITYVRA